MNYATAHIATTLKNAREAKGLSQRALSQLAGIPQSHISKIESGAVDLRLSSLVELGRVLDLELALVPRKSVSAVNSIVRSSRDGRSLDRSGSSSKSAVNELKQLQKHVTDITRLHPVNTELAQMQRQLRDLQHLKIPALELGKLREINKSVQALKESGNTDSIRKTLSEIQSLRNAIAHSTARIPSLETVRPAYSLEEDNHGK